jgi:phosphopantothenoylcysteine decarboxylase/phosphopantothenate--cysteine ligase
MGHLNNRNIIIGVTGGIAAYKAAELVRLLRKAGAAVKVVMTRGATEFITPLTLQALSGEAVYSELLNEDAEAGMGHIELARWADALLIAPATADVLSRLAQGRADDLLTTVALATPAPLFVAPAMNQQMWAAQSTADNIATLMSRGVTVIGPDAGEQACGDIGPGRLLDPEHIVALVAAQFDTRMLAGKRVVITAGPTREPLDPVRYLSNHSSGKMGFALAAAAAEAGADVILIAGPVNLDTPSHVTRYNVNTAAEMHDQALKHAEGADAFIGAAAVADYRPAESAVQKIKKSGETLQLTLVQNPDIIASVGKLPAVSRPRLVVGFAAETESLQAHARDKLARKNLDFVIANDVSRDDIGFNSDMNHVYVINRHGIKELPMANKRVLSGALIALVAQWLEKPS